MIDTSTHFGCAQIRCNSINISGMKRIFGAHDEEDNIVYQNLDNIPFYVEFLPDLLRVTKYGYRIEIDN